MTKTIIIACATGVATSTLVAKRVEELAKKNGINIKLIQCKIAEVASKQGEADLIVTSTILPTTYSIPAIKATAYITGIGAEKVDNQILEVLKS
ncbi:PTS sugar transporter subunit IIB [Alkaliphilus crotonatoxidans]